MYADQMTDSIRRAIEETDRRRHVQQAYNERLGVVPETVYKSRDEILQTTAVADARQEEMPAAAEEASRYEAGADIMDVIADLEDKMARAAAELAFERAAEYRDRINQLKSGMKGASDDAS